MKRTFDQILCIVATGCMFAFPVLLLGLTPWLGERFLDTAHFEIGSSFHAVIRAMLVMLGSSASVLLIGIPAFGMVVWGLLHVSGREAAQSRKAALARARDLKARRIDLPAEAGESPAAPARAASAQPELRLNATGRRVRPGQAQTQDPDVTSRVRRAALSRLQSREPQEN